MRVLGRRIYWRWYGEVLLSGGVLLRMSGDAAKWLRPGERVRLRTELKKPVLGFEEYALEGAFPLWPPFAKTLEHVRESPLGGEAYRYRLKVREATYEGDYEAIAELEQFHYASEKEVVALWVCTRCHKTLPANAKPLCDCGGEARLKEIRGSTPASRFLVLELLERLPFEPRILGYLRLDPPIPRMHRRTPEGVERDIRERIFPRDWFHPTYEGGADWERALDRVETAASRIARVVVHPDYRSEALGPFSCGWPWSGRRSGGRRRGEGQSTSFTPSPRWPATTPSLRRWASATSLTPPREGPSSSTPSRRKPRPTWSASCGRTPTPRPTGEGSIGPGSGGSRG